nr:P-loop NTPase [Candidatus Sigynarchaeota archaeon]
MNDGGNKFLKIGVVSGKGGVGKSTLTAALCKLYVESKKRIVAVDCDVDAPNLALMFTQEGKAKTIPVHTTEKAFTIDDKCTSCKSCITDTYCIYSAIKWNEDTRHPEINTIACEGCGACAVLCEQNAYGIHAIESGQIKVIEASEGMPLVYGETIIGASTSGKMVAETKQIATNKAENEKREIMMIDGPPGIGCPVLATLTGLDYCIVVVEPFPAALHDAKRVIEIITNFSIPFGIVINRTDAWDTGRNTIIEFMEKNGYTLLGEIPIDMKVPESVVHMKNIITYAPDSPSALAIYKVFSVLNERVEHLQMART